MHMTQSVPARVAVTVAVTVAAAEIINERETVRWQNLNVHFLLYSD